MAQQIKKKFLGSDQVDGSKILLSNAEFIRAKTADGLSHVNVFRVNASDKIEFSQAPLVSIEGTEENSLQTKSQLDVAVAAEAVIRAAADTANSDAIDAEEARALAAEGVLQSNIDAEEDRALAAEAALQAAITAVNTGLAWKPTAFLISEDPELQAAVEGDLVSAIMPFSDDETPLIELTDFAAGQFLIAKNGSNSKIMKVIDDAGTLKVSFVGVDAMVAGHTFVVVNDFTDSPGPQENRSIWNFTGTEMIKLGDFDWSLASGIDLSVAYESLTGTIVVGDSVEVAIGKLVGNLAAEAARALAAEGVLQGNIDAEESRALAAEAALQGEIDAVESDLAQELLDRAAADTALQGNIDTEASDRAAADLVLQGNIDSEQASREAADIALQSDIDSEVSRALAAEAALESRLDTAESDIAAIEASNAAVEGRLDTAEADIDALEAADVALDSRIDALEGLDPLEYKGTWDASTNTPSLADGVGDNGDVYRVTVAGSVDFGAGSIQFSIGDKVVYNGTNWEKWDMTDAVDSVNGQQGAVVLDADDILMLDGVTTVESKLNSLQGEVDAVESDLAQELLDRAAADTALQGEIDAVEAALAQELLDRAAADTALQGEIDAAEGEIDALQVDVADHESRITTLENQTANWHKIKITLDATDITNGYVDLAHTALANSIVAFVDRLGMHKDEDFTVSVEGSVTRITFAGEMASAGSQALEDADNLYFTYQY